MLVDEIERYFHSLSYGKKRETFCERCGIGIGEDKINKTPHRYYIKRRCFILCDDCYYWKTHGYTEICNGELKIIVFRNTPDIEDLTVE